MQFKRVFTMLTALGAIGTALAGTAGAKQLLQPEAGWYADEAGQNPLPPQQAADCTDGSDETCGYLFDGISEVGEKHYYPL